MFAVASAFTHSVVKPKKYVLLICPFGGGLLLTMRLACDRNQVVVDQGKRPTLRKRTVFHGFSHSGASEGLLP